MKAKRTLSAMRSTRPATVLRGVAALAAMLALVLGVPVLLLAMIGNPIPHQWSWDQPLTNDAILGVVACAAWLLWAQLAVCVAVETIAEIRLAAGRSADWLSRVPGTFSGQQAMARTLVQAVVALGITSSAVAAAPTAWTPHAHAAAFAEPAQNARAATPINRALSQQASGTSPAPTTGPAVGLSAAPAVNPKQIPTKTVEVRKGDTLWSIAETHLGAGERWRQIAVLNHGRLMADGQRFLDADRIRPGWDLLIPEPTDHAGAHGTNTDPQLAGVNGATVATVRAGDSLWDIAEREYGAGDLWPQIYQANRAQIHDPDVIHTGQHLTVPPQAHEQAHRHPTKQADGQPPTRTTPRTNPHRTRQVEVPAQHRLQPTPPSPTPSSSEPPPTPPAPPPSAKHSGDRPVGSSSGEEESDSDEGSAVFSTLARTLAGGGVLLGGCLAAAYAARRRAQARVRRSGRTIPRTRPELVEVEADVRSAGLAGGKDVAFLDRALRDLAMRSSRLPDVVAARLTEDAVELVLAEPLTPAPTGWHVEGGVEGRAERGATRWRLPRSHPLGESSAPAPYPTLVTVGLDPDGGTWLIDLEAAGLIQLDGPPALCDDVLRFLAAELGTNRWSDVVKVWFAGIGTDLVRLNPDRLNLLEEVDLEPLVNKTLRVVEIREANHLDVLTGRQNLHSGDAWNPQLILTGTSTATSDTVAQEFLQARRGQRSATAWVASGEASPEASPGGLRMVIDQKGYAALPWVDRVLLNRLSLEDAQALGAAFAGTEDLHDEPMPAGPLAQAGPVAGLADEAGALLRELTRPRPAEGSTRSLLPELNAAYLAAAATTVEDLNTLTPETPSDIEDTVRAADPHLESDLAEWRSGTVARPQLRLLGPIELRVDRPVPTAAQRRVAYLTEVAAYLACHPGGVTSTRLGDVFGVQATTIHKRIQELRDWLGEDPATGIQRLPEAKLSQPGTARGVGNYVLTDVLCDIDLFRRLRVRGQARGDGGIEDLTAALGLVAGPPFDQQRPHGYGWLASDPTDHHLTAAIVDVAHIVATAALAAGEAERAAWAATQATSAAPYEDTPHLDYAAALEAMGHHAEANAHLDREVFNRSDDDLAPPDPTARVTQVAARQQQRIGQISVPTSHSDRR
jgi:nucleoid-associated protein YgaU